MWGSWRAYTGSSFRRNSSESGGSPWKHGRLALFTGSNIGITTRQLPSPLTIAETIGGIGLAITHVPGDVHRKGAKIKE